MNKALSFSTSKQTQINLDKAYLNTNDTVTILLRVTFYNFNQSDISILTQSTGTEYYRYTLCACSNRRLYAWNSNDGGYIDFNIDLNINEPITIAIVLDKNHVTYIVNGVVVYDREGTDFSTSNTQISGYCSGQYLDGAIDDFKIYNKVLSIDRINEEFELNSVTDGMILYFDFDEIKESDGKYYAINKVNQKEYLIDNYDKQINGLYNFKKFLISKENLLYNVKDNQLNKIESSELTDDNFKNNGFTPYALKKFLNNNTSETQFDLKIYKEE